MKTCQWTRPFGALAITALLIVPAARAEAHGRDGMFEKMDANGDGKVSADEHAAEAKKMFEMMDSNKDGKVNVAEMTAAHAKMFAAKGGDKGEAKAEKPDAKEMSAADKIKVIDTNGDGVLSAEEHAAGSKMMFDKMDADHDGSLTKAEMTAGHAKLLHKATK